MEENQSMRDKREELLNKIWKAQDEAYALMYEYDSLPHCYGETVLYQAEAYIVNLIGEYQDITTTELALILGKTASACSQIIHKLKNKELVEQIRNEENNRLYNLRLTEKGKKHYQAHVEFNRYCQELTFARINLFSDKELEIHLKVQEKINEAYKEDVQRSKEKFLNHKKIE